MVEIKMDKLVSINIFNIYFLYIYIDQQQIMNLINSVTSGMNFNFGNSFFNGNFNNFNNNYNNNVENNYNDDNEEESEEGNNEEIELFMKKREQFILELDEFQYKHLTKYSALKEDKCAICLVKYKGIDIIKEFPCKHIFHKNCIFKWLKTSNFCPLCKYDISNDVNKVVLKNEEDE